jgi:hypothetical protein
VTRGCSHTSAEAARSTDPDHRRPVGELVAHDQDGAPGAIIDRVDEIAIETNRGAHARVELSELSNGVHARDHRIDIDGSSAEHLGDHPSPVHERHLEHLRLVPLRDCLDAYGTGELRHALRQTPLPFAAGR